MRPFSWVVVIAIVLGGGGTVRADLFDDIPLFCTIIRPQGNGQSRAEGWTWGRIWEQANLSPNSVQVDHTAKRDVPSPGERITFLR